MVSPASGMGPAAFARAIDGHLGPATTSTPVTLRRGDGRPGAESVDGITLRDGTVRENARRAAVLGASCPFRTAADRVPNRLICAGLPPPFLPAVARTGIAGGMAYWFPGSSGKLRS